MTEEIQKLLGFHDATPIPTGSRYICNPAPSDTDEDYLVPLASDAAMAALIDDLEARGFEWDHGEGYDGSEGPTFMSFRQGNLNLLLTCDADFAQKHQVATNICKRLNLLQKADRIMVFQGVLYGNYYNPQDETVQ